MLLIHGKANEAKFLEMKRDILGASDDEDEDEEEADEEGRGGEGYGSGGGGGGGDGATTVITDMTEQDLVRGWSS